MARLARLALPGLAHAVLQVGIGPKPVFVDEQDRRHYLAVLFETAAAESTRIHAWALLDGEVRLVVTPQEAPQLARLLQGVGRRYVAAYNRRHNCKGALWAGRFRSAVLEPGSAVLDALLWADGASALPGHTSAGQRNAAPHLGPARAGAAAATAGLVDPTEHWQLGNTPFEREAAYRQLLQNGLPANREGWLRAAVWGGWVAGSSGFAHELTQLNRRRASPKAPGRPSREAASNR